MFARRLAVMVDEVLWVLPLLLLLLLLGLEFFAIAEYCHGEEL